MAVIVNTNMLLERESSTQLTIPSSKFIGRAIGNIKQDEQIRGLKVDNLKHNTHTTLLSIGAALAGSGSSCTFSPNGEYLVITYATSPYISFYKRNADTFTKLENPEKLPTTTTYKCRFSKDGKYLAVPYGAKPYLIIYKCENDSFIKMPDPENIEPEVEYTYSSNVAYGCAFSNDGQFLAIAHHTSPFITVYKFDAEKVEYIKINDPDVLPSSRGNSCAFSSDDAYLAVAHDTSPYISIYKLNKDTLTLTKLAHPIGLPTNNGQDCVFSSDGLLAVTHGTSRYITIYEREGDEFSKISDPDILPTGLGYSCSFGLDDNYLAIGHDTSPYITIYKRNGTEFSKLDNLASLPPGTVNGVSFSPNSIYLAAVHSTTPFARIYRILNSNAIIPSTFAEASQASIDDKLAFAGFGHAKTSENDGDTIQADILFTE